ncbi:GH3 auxin-responsive promoter family protein [Bdellovibrionota bacterium FG-2]
MFSSISAAVVPAARTYFSHLAKRLERACMDPRAEQAQTISRLVSSLGGSEVGQSFGLAAVRGPEDARRMPFTDSTVLKSYLNKVYKMGGEGSGVFGRSRVLAFGQTSGTTSEPKRVPLTREYFSSYRRSTLLMNAMFFHTTGKWDRLFSGKHLILGARPKVETTSDGLPVGYVSGIMATKVPWMMRSRLLPTPEILDIPEWDEKFERILEQCECEDVQMIAGVPLLVGAFSERALARYKVKQLVERWPNLGALVFGGVTLSPRGKKDFAQMWGVDPSFVELYAATEGQFGHTFHSDWPGMVFNPFENFYQFLELGSDGETSSGPYLQMHELGKGKRYVFFVTTPGGLVNYRMGDVIEVLSDSPICFRVAGREREELSVAGEKITPDQLEKVMGDLEGGPGGAIEDYAIWIEEGRPNRLVWGVSFKGQAGKGQATDGHWNDPSFADRLDRALCTHNPVYQELRLDDFGYSMSKVVCIERGVFQRFRDRHLDHGQFKGRKLYRSRAEFERDYGVLTYTSQVAP